jgi:hypothetical protein
VKTPPLQTPKALKPPPHQPNPIRPPPHPTQASLKRLGQDYVDVVFAHRPDANTPIEETVRAFNHVIDHVRGGWRPVRGWGGV